MFDFLKHDLLSILFMFFLLICLDDKIDTKRSRVGQVPGGCESPGSIEISLHSLLSGVGSHSNQHRCHKTYFKSRGNLLTAVFHEQCGHQFMTF